MDEDGYLYGSVLILVLMEYGLREIIKIWKGITFKQSLNPCFNGIWSASYNNGALRASRKHVLILVLMEYGLRETTDRTAGR